MAEHYTRNTSGVLKFCNTCGKMTMHKVSNKRIGLCQEPHAVGMSQKQKKQASKPEEEPSLF